LDRFGDALGQFEFGEAGGVTAEKTYVGLEMFRAADDAGEIGWR
jgi:hypothetical protein